MKRYYEFTLANSNGKNNYFLIDITKITVMTHNSDEGLHGTTMVAFNEDKYSFSGENNKTIYDNVALLMRQLETGE